MRPRQPNFRRVGFQAASAAKFSARGIVYASGASRFEGVEKERLSKRAKLTREY
jgi:hypothetical protein